MFDYFLASRDVEGKVEHRAVCGMCVDEVKANLAHGYLGPGWEMARVVARPTPVWDIVLPALGRTFMVGGHECRSKREHFLAGGTLACTYMDEDYEAVPVIYGKDRKVMEDGNSITAIGEVTVRACRNPAHVSTSYLEPLDESHALELLDGLLIDLDAHHVRIQVVDYMA